MITCTSKLAESGGDVEITWHWTYAGLRRRSFVKRKGTTAKSKHSTEDFAQLRLQFLDNVMTTVMHGRNYPS